MSVYMKLLVVICLMLMTLSHVGAQSPTAPTGRHGHGGGHHGGFGGHHGGHHGPVIVDYGPIDYGPLPPMGPPMGPPPPRPPPPPPPPKPTTTLPPASSLTDEQRSDIVKKHNELRALEGSSDMEMMTWNESLAAAAKKWVKQCKWGHGFPPLPGTNIDEYGQNVHLLSLDETKVVDRVQDWYDAKRDYHYDKAKCADGKSCWHYTQVVWAKSRQVGCAIHHCDTVENAYCRNVEYLACNYLPAGNVPRDRKPYKKKPPCSQCESGAGWCKNKLCNSQCTKAGKDCSCQAICHNCATLNITTCRCSCADGWHGPDCSERCEDKHEDCNPSSFDSGGWHPVLCTQPDWGDRIRGWCPLMCGECTPDPDAVAGKCRPLYAAGARRASRLTASGDVSQHQQQGITLTLLSNIILSLTIAWKAALL